MGRRLIANSRPAERARGCVFCERFRTYQEIADNGMALVVNIPDFSVPGRVTFNGSQRMDYARGNSVVRGNNAFTLLVEALPTSAPVLAVIAGFGRNSLTRGPYVGMNALTGPNNVWIGNYGGALTGSYTFDGRPHQIGFVYEGAAPGALGVSRLFVDGVQLNTAAGFAIDVDDPTVFVGNHAAGGYPYYGDVRGIRIFDRALSAEELRDYANGSMWSYRNRASIALQMRQVDHDSANNRTLDTSGYGRHAVWTPGATQPTKLAGRHGYDFDGGDYLTVPATGVLNTVARSYVLEFEADFSLTDGLQHYFYDTSSANRDLLVKDAAGGLIIWMNSTALANPGVAVVEPFWRKGGRNTLVVSSASGKTNAWLNNGRIVTDAAVVWTPGTPSALWLGSSYVPSLYHDGRITRFFSYPFALNPMQAEDVRIQLGLTTSEV